MKKFLFLSVALLTTVHVCATKPHRLLSPDKRIEIVIHAADEISYSVYADGIQLLRDNVLGLTVSGRGDLTRQTAVTSAKSKKVTETISAPFYRTPRFEETYNQLSLNLHNGLAIEFRAYNSGVAYRYVLSAPNGSYEVESERAEFNFPADGTSYLPYSTNPKKPMAMAFQATYERKPLSQQTADNLAFLPATVDCRTAKVTLMESDLENYPGMFIRPDGTSLRGEFAHEPKSFDYYPWRQQKYVTDTEDYLVRVTAGRTFPWRIIAISHDDTEMPVNNLVYALAAPSRVEDISWIQPGLVAWDWWNDWGISGVDFEAGINTQTYQYYIDFAAKYHLPYIILDEGWYAPKSGDMLTTIHDIDLPHLVSYGLERGVRIILWTVFNVLDNQLEAACLKYADMGIAGFKVDFLDRDDAESVRMVYRIAEACARHHLLLDYHGIYKPTGINRTYPNIINFESCFGMEEAKWTKHDEKDMPLYDVTFPFIRMQCGFADFTPGGMRNATRADFQPIYSNPLTMGTRCHQMAMYIVQDSPLTMLADNPTAYEREPEYTALLASLPTTFDQTLIPQGKLAEYIVTARRKGADWYVGGQTNWNPRDLTLRFDFLQQGISYDATLIQDGANAGKTGTDYVIRKLTIHADTTLNLHLAGGGGFVIILHRK